MLTRKARPDDTIRVLTLDRPEDIEELKLMGAELDNDTGRTVYTAIYNGTRTISEIAQALNISVQLASYHVEKLLMAGLIEEQPGSVLLSQKGKKVAHYIPSYSALLIMPSLDSLKADERDKVKAAFGSLIKRLTGTAAIGVTSFIAINRGIVALYAWNLKSAVTGGQVSFTSISASSVVSAGIAGVPPLLSMAVPFAAAAALSCLSFVWLSRRFSRKVSDGGKGNAKQGSRP
ncbi:MAG: winged helix-turn-helix transcriptional regulator [Nitrososphaerota archaeon]|jgi:DNA-binding MarR family transcriptional regulator|nr:winged helix-turn-helix transcriptional regulator [Nitrososphaerota archaeon]MDG6936579.1 winged helix-turn-helix transcriptional regulator [Nitrososphaerota archaeon]MDG6943572.1 winged helix-turn-helix transcriptional regulator [Nitrososphaerota archaeon]